MSFFLSLYPTGRNRPQRVVPLPTRCPQRKPGAARFDGQEGRQNLRHRAGRLQSQRTDLVVCHFQFQRQCHSQCRCCCRRRRRWPTERQRVVQLAVTVAISVLLHRTESSEGTPAEDEVQGHLKRKGRRLYSRFLLSVLFCLGCFS